MSNSSNSSSSIGLSHDDMTRSQSFMLECCVLIVLFYVPYMLMRLMYPKSRMRLVGSSSLVEGDMASVVYEGKHYTDARILTVFEDDNGIPYEYQVEINSNIAIVPEKDTSPQTGDGQKEKKKSLIKKCLTCCTQSRNKNYYQWSDSETQILRSIIKGNMPLFENVCRHEWPEFQPRCWVCGSKYSFHDKLWVLLMGGIRIIAQGLMIMVLSQSRRYGEKIDEPDEPFTDDWITFMTNAYIRIMFTCLILLNLGFYVLPKRVKQHAFAISLGLIWSPALVEEEQWKHYKKTRRGRLDAQERTKRESKDISVPAAAIYNGILGPEICTAVSGATLMVATWVWLPVIGAAIVVVQLFGGNLLHLHDSGSSLFVAIDLAVHLSYGVAHYLAKKKFAEPIPIEEAKKETRQYRLIIPFVFNYTAQKAQLADNEMHHKVHMNMGVFDEEMRRRQDMLDTVAAHLESITQAHASISEHFVEYVSLKVRDDVKITAKLFEPAVRRHRRKVRGGRCKRENWQDIIEVFVDVKEAIATMYFDHFTKGISEKKDSEKHVSLISRYMHDKHGRHTRCDVCAGCGLHTKNSHTHLFYEAVKKMCIIHHESSKDTRRVAALKQFQHIMQVVHLNRIKIEAEKNEKTAVFSVLAKIKSGVKMPGNDADAICTEHVRTLQSQVATKRRVPKFLSLFKEHSEMIQFRQVRDILYQLDVYAGATALREMYDPSSVIGKLFQLTPDDCSLMTSAASKTKPWWRKPLAVWESSSERSERDNTRPAYPSQADMRQYTIAWTEFDPYHANHGTTETEDDFLDDDQQTLEEEIERSRTQGRKKRRQSVAFKPRHKSAVHKDPAAVQEARLQRRAVFSDLKSELLEKEGLMDFRMDKLSKESKHLEDQDKNSLQPLIDAVFDGLLDVDKLAMKCHNKNRARRMKLKLKQCFQVLRSQIEVNDKVNDLFNYFRGSYAAMHLDVISIINTVKECQHKREEKNDDEEDEDEDGTLEADTNEGGDDDDDDDLLKYSLLSAVTMTDTSSEVTTGAKTVINVLGEAGDLEDEAAHKVEGHEDGAEHEEVEGSIFTALSSDKGAKTGEGKKSKRAQSKVKAYMVVPVSEAKMSN